MPPAKKKPITAVDEQRNLTTFFSLRDVGYMIVTGIMVASAFFTFGTRISVLEQSEVHTQQTITELKSDDQLILELGAELNYKLADIIAKENRLIIDVERIRKRLHELELKGGAKK